jgi:hypothetical protein
MHLPFTQIASEVVDQSAAELAAFLAIEETTALGQLVFLFQGALSRVPEGEMPSDHDLVAGRAATRLVAAWAHHRGDPEVFADACEQLSHPVLERTKDGLRLRGLDRYDRVIKEQRARSQKARTAAAARWQTPSNAGSSAQASPEQSASSAPRCLERDEDEDGEEDVDHDRSSSSGTRGCGKPVDDGGKPPDPPVGSGQDDRPARPPPRWLKAIEVLDGETEDEAQARVDGVDPPIAPRQLAPTDPPGGSP